MSHSTPAAAFMAVLYQAPAPTEEDAEAASRLSEPLLPRGDDAAVVTCSVNSMISPSFVARLKTLSFVTGILVAVLSQYLLSLLLWSDAIMSQSSHKVVLFSLAWSLATCGMVFVSMIGMVQMVTSNINTRRGSRELSDLVFQMEAHHIIGALLTISLVWIVIDVLRVNPSGVVRVMAGLNAWISAAVVCASLLTYVLLVKCWLRNSVQQAAVETTMMSPEETRSQSLMTTYQLIAGTLGLLAGLCSQFFLSFCLWKNQMTEPLIDNVVVFSLVWSLCTVAVTFCGCLSLRLLTTDSNNINKTTMPLPSSNNDGDKDTAEQVFLRMESYYVFFSLIGICLAWILIDVVLDMREQIFPSLLMLSVSLACFAVILQCFPDPARTTSLADEELNEEVAIAAETSPKLSPADVMMV